MLFETTRKERSVANLFVNNVHSAFFQLVNLSKKGCACQLYEWINLMFVKDYYWEFFSGNDSTNFHLFTLEILRNKRLFFK